MLRWSTCDGLSKSVAWTVLRHPVFLKLPLLHVLGAFGRITSCWRVCDSVGLKATEGKEKAWRQIFANCWYWYVQRWAVWIKRAAEGKLRKPALKRWRQKKSQNQLKTLRKLQKKESALKGWRSRECFLGWWQLAFIKVGFYEVIRIWFRHKWSHLKIQNSEDMITISRIWIQRQIFHEKTL